MKLKYKMSFLDMDGRKMAVPLDGSDRFRGVLEMNGTAGRIIELLGESATEDGIVATLAEEYDAPVSVIRDNVRKVLGILREQGLLEE